MNRSPRTRFVTLMAAAAGVSAGLASMAAPTPALARTPAAAALSVDTVPKSKSAHDAKKAAPSAKEIFSAAKAKVDAKATAKTKADAAKPAAKAIVATAGPNNPSPNDACADDPDCRNINGDGAGY